MPCPYHACLRLFSWIKGRICSLGKGHLSLAVMTFAVVAFGTATAFAQPVTQEVANASGQTVDWAAAIISFLFQGVPLPAEMPVAGARLAPVAEALRHAMGIYGKSMLGLAGLLLLYHVLAMVAETANHGVVMGRRANQVWTPIRLVIAIALLLPMGGGLSAGQNIVLKIATTGSNMASRVWENILPAFGNAYFTLIPPRSPDLASFVTTTVEMEMCRALYEQARTAQQVPESVARLAGPIGNIDKLAATGLVPETWRYSNLMNNGVPMCGEFRFSGYRLQQGGASPLYAEGMAHLADSVEAFSHAEAETILSQAKGVASYSTPVFSNNDLAATATVQAHFAALQQRSQQLLDNHLQLLATAQTAVAGKYLSQMSHAGWITASFFIPNLVWLQEGYGELVAHILPDIQEPVFIHRTLTQQVLNDTVAADVNLNNIEHEIIESVGKLYGRVSRSTSRLHGWLYGVQSEKISYPPSTGFDLREQTSAATEATSAFILFGHLLDSAAVSYGVWGEVLGQKDGGNPFILSNRAELYNPLAALVEFGRRQLDLGLYLVGVASGAMTLSQILIPSILTALLGVLFIVCGGGLIFLIPLMPFVRFFVAVVVWLIELVEALIAIPLVALAHMTTTGEGMMGSAARQAYVLWIRLAIRPVLTVFGLVVGVLIFSFGLVLLQLVIVPLAQGAALTSSGLLIVANTGLVLTYDVLAYVLMNVAFKGVSRFSDKALAWITPFVMTDAHQTVVAPQPQQIAAVAATHVSGALGSPKKHQGSTAADGSHTGKTGGEMAQSSLFPYYQEGAQSGSLATIDAAHPDKQQMTGNLATATAHATAMASATIFERDNKTEQEKDKKKRDKDKGKDGFDPLAELIQAPNRREITAQDKKEVKVESKPQTADKGDV